MQNSATINLEKTLDDLSSSSFPAIRRTAAHRLGQLTISNGEIVQALVAADTLDSDAGVRSAARQALQSPVHQDFIKNNPGFVQMAAESAARMQREEQQRKEEKIIAEFIQRRSRQRKYSLLPLCGVMIPLCTLVLLQQEWLIHAFSAINTSSLIVFFGLWFWLSWKNWRCPACDWSLGGWKFQVNPFFSTEPLRCPHCGARLL